MKPFESKHLIVLLGVVALAFSGCASDGSQPTAQQTSQQIEAPQTTASEPDKGLFSQALKAQNAGQFESAIQLWQSFLAKHPDSFEGHNNLGLVYYTQDMLTQALQEFEAAYELQPSDERIRNNLARALRFKAGMLHENREYFKTLEILTWLEQIVEPEEKQGILFKQEQVEDQIFLQVIKADNSAAYQDFINRFPDGLNAVRAREYLEEHPQKVARSISNKKSSNRKSWISSGKVVKNPSGGSGDLSSWASAEQPPQYGSSKPSAVYTPPPAGTPKKKEGDFFGVDSGAVEETENVNASQEIDPVVTVPFEDFEKPERSSGELAAAQEPADSKDEGRVVHEFSPMSGGPDEVAMGLDTLPDLEPSEVAALPEEMEAPLSDDASAGDIAMQPAGQEQAEAVTALVEDAVEETVREEATPGPAMGFAQSEGVFSEPAQPEPAQEMEAEPQASPEEVPMEEAGISEEVESTGQESVESESERIARIVKEEIAKDESAQPEPEQPEFASEMETEPQAGTEDETMEVASFDPEDQDVQQESLWAESAPAEETPTPPDSEEKEQINRETVSETVAALIPPLPAKVMEAPADSMDSSNTVVVVQMSAGSTLNVRAEPSIQGEILGYLENGDMMPFMNESGDWYQIEIEEGLSGWVSRKYTTTRNVASEASLSVPETELTSELAPLQTDDQQPSSDAMVVVTVAEEGILNVRSLPSPSGAVVDMLFRGDRLPLVKEEGDWYQVRFEDDTTGWISKKFSVVEGGATRASLEESPAEVSSPAPKAKKVDYWNTPVKKESEELVTTVVVIKVPEGSSLNVRSAPSPQGEVMGSLKNGDMRPLVEETDEWYQIELQDGQSGWVNRQFSGKMDLGESFLQNP